MIVLGPHVRSALGPDACPPAHDDGTAGPGTDEGHGSDASSADGTDDPPSRSSPPRPPRPPRRVFASPAARSALGRARAVDSSALGSVGAPPLTAGQGFSFDGEDREIESLEAYLGSIEQLATSHAALLGQARTALAIVRTGTAVRLGLGPGGGRRGASRAERAWAARLARRQCGAGGGEEPGGGTPEADAPGFGGVRRRAAPPALSMHRLRVALHGSIADAALSLLDVLDLATPIREDGCPWEEFGSDLRHSLDGPPVLTLSRLAGWADGLAGLLSRVLSACLAGPAAAVDRRGPLERAVRRSARLAEERASYLEGAASGARPNIIAGEAGASDPSSRRRAARMALMGDALEAARVSLLAFGQAVEGEDGRSLPGDESSRGDERRGGGGGLDSSDGWWAHFALLLGRLAASASEFEEEFVRPGLESADENQARADAEDDGGDALSHAVISPRDGREVIESDAPPSCSSPTTPNGVQGRPPEERVLVFSGRGTGAARRQARSGAGGRPPAAPSVRCKADLMDDLRSRLRSMGTREEVEAARPDGYGGDDGRRVDGGSSTAGGDADPATSRPLFLGVSGAMLAELAGALEVQSRGGGGDEMGR